MKKSAALSAALPMAHVDAIGVILILSMSFFSWSYQRIATDVEENFQLLLGAIRLLEYILLIT